MKKETAEERLNKLLNIDPELIEKEKRRKAALEASRTGKLQGISEAEIQHFREMQGIIYFLAAPQLFHFKVCPHCGAPFFVSRLFVNTCSYTCIRAILKEELGSDWEKGNDLEALANDPHVWKGNEPIWIRNIEKLKLILQHLTSVELPEQLEPTPPRFESLPTDTSPEEPLSLFPEPPPKKTKTTRRAFSVK